MKPKRKTASDLALEWKIMGEQIEAPSVSEFARKQLIKERVRILKEYKKITGK
ncbi:MAG: hypothetical protein KAJ49_05990 [Arcobacteraceae bacterium]|nr:hypothetical protein [Arcobacteraceae bacterium]